MPKPDDDRARPEPAPVTPPTLPPDFPESPSSELQPPPEPSAAPDKVAGTMPAPAEPETSRRKNARLRERIDQVLEKHPELRDVTEKIALGQDMHAQVGTPFLERVQGKLQERARAIIERRPDLEHYFDD
jgi:hypothetical protein